MPRADVTRTERLSLALFFGLAGSVHALNVDRAVSQYGHTAWRLTDGVFQGAPHALTQTRDGYIWIGTEVGLVRFDGVRFVPWVPPAGEALPDTVIVSLAGARDGSLWIGTGSGISHWGNGHLVNYPAIAGRINALVEDREGSIWMAKSRPRDESGPLCRVKNGEARCFGKADGISLAWAQTLVDDRHGGLWIGATAGVCHWSPASADSFLSEKLKHLQGSTGVEGLALAANGALLVGIGQTGAGAGLQSIVSGAWKPYAVPGIDASSLSVTGLFVDRDEALWISTVNEGLYHTGRGSTDRYRQADGLSSDTVRSFYEDREGSMWTVSERGIDRFRELPVSTLSKREGLMADVVGSLFSSPNGTLWLASGQWLVSLREGKFLATNAANGLPGSSVTSIFEDRAGRLWAGVDSELAAMQGGHLRLIKRQDGTAIGMVTAIAQDTQGNVWALATGKPRNLFRIQDLAVREMIPQSAGSISLVADRTDGIWLGDAGGNFRRYRSGKFDVVVASDGEGRVQDLLAAADGSVWGATPKGLIRWKEGRRARLDHSNGLPCDGAFSAVDDDAGALWVYATCGMLRVSRDELRKWWEHPAATIAVTVFDVFDGAAPGRTPFGPAAMKGPGGRLWFTNENVAQFVDPTRVPRNSVPPPVHIEEVIADRKRQAPIDNMRLPARTGDLQIDYTALSFVVPQKVRFRYRLEGRDETWRDSGTRRQAFYSDLSPGPYRFRVIACNNDGVWNETGASWSFRVTPAYYQTVWFRLLCLALAVLALWAAYQVRMWQIAASLNARFDERMAERNRLAGELHDTFLQSVQASKMLADQAVAEQQMDAAHLRQTIEKLSRWLGQATLDGRAALNFLRKSTALKNDLAEAFRHAAEASRYGGSTQFALSIEGESREVHPIVRDEVYRLGSELIRNSFQFSGADLVTMKIGYAQDLTVRVGDNGKSSRNSMTGSHVFEDLQRRAARIGGQVRAIGHVPELEIELKVPGRIAFHDFSRNGFLARVANRLWSLRKQFGGKK